MTIRMRAKLRPYSHEMGTRCLIPGSSWAVTPYPSQIDFVNLERQKEQESFSVSCSIEGPLDEFTVMQDLERGCVRVFGRGKQGMFSYCISFSNSKITLFLDRAVGEIVFVYRSKKWVLKRKEYLEIPTSSTCQTFESKEKLHFGCYKAQDWTLLKRRLSLKEILPIWFALGKTLGSIPSLDVGASRPLLQCKESIEKRDRVAVGSHFLHLFRVGFEGMFSPNLDDFNHQSFKKEPIPSRCSPLVLLSAGAKIIRQMFVEEDSLSLKILPCLPVELHAGRFMGVQCRDLLLDFEWTKKQIFRVLLKPQIDRTYHLKFQSAIKSFRLRRGIKHRGEVCQVGSPLHLKAGTSYMLDRFKH